MIHALLSTALLLFADSAAANLLDIYRLEDGHTNWQYVANTTGGVTILALSYTLLRLFLSNRTAKRYNRELEEIRSELEDRVKERTATLDESNRQLQESNADLEEEIREHRATADRLRQSESYINSILRSMPLALIGLNNRGEISQWNWQAERASGLRECDALGRNLWQAFPTITVTPYQVQRAQRENRTLTIKQSQRGGFHFDVTIYPLTDHAETGVVILIDDVTQRVVAENMLIQRDKMSSMGELAGSLAQDISIPLNAMLMDIREARSRAEAREYPAGEDPDEMLEEALQRGERLSAVITNLLELSSPRKGDRKMTNITRLIDHSLELAGSIITVPSGLKFSEIHLDRQFAADLPRIPCYATELQQVLISLFRHCCQAMGESRDQGREPTITLEANSFYDALWLKISHNGKGMSPEEQQHLFEPFFTDSNKTAAEDYDAGRRLSYPYFIITEQHRGQMAVTSDPEIGTTFHLQFPLA